MAQTVNQLLLQLNTSGARLERGQEGYRAEADTVIRFCETFYPCPVSQFSQIWKTTKQKILYSRHLMSGNWVKAETALSLFIALPAPAAMSSHQPATGSNYNELYRAELLF